MTSLHESVSASVQIDQIQLEISALRRHQEALCASIKDLLFRENPEKGTVFSREIFQLQQDKLRVETEIQFHEVRLRRLTANW